MIQRARSIIYFPALLILTLFPLSDVIFGITFPLAICLTRDKRLQIIYIFLIPDRFSWDSGGRRGVRVGAKDLRSLSQIRL